MAVLLRAQYPGVPLYLAGESMGGAVALVAADQGIEVDGLILVSAALRSRDTFGPVLNAGVWFFAHTIPWFPNGPTSIDFQPTDNPKTLDKLRNDLMMLRAARMDMGYGLLDLMDAARASAERVHMPYLMLHGLGDRIIPQEPVRAAIAVMPPRGDSSSPSTRRVTICCCATRKARWSPTTSSPGCPITKRGCLPARTPPDRSPR